MTQRRSRVVGVSRLRRLLNRLPKEETKELRKVVKEGVNNILLTQRFLVPKKSYELLFALSSRLSSDGLTGRAGLLTVRRQRKYFYARFLEYGTKGYPPRNIPPLTPRPFLGPSFDLNKEEILEEVSKSIKIALKRASEGAGPFQ